ncbi:ABC transporter ATP-binding protein [Salinicola endophyticus]|uniref:ABC transporter ATP-binding protein n=1 Tax=Salinicola endophyticus TaxID=1949083 RepID=A0ABY8FIS8_9GAMM|nr:ABC transporter ATP-binding protein [Salinicola endophyticus]WFF42718.1 ABC transporter ATP-binding protein [Salinicola endophyticus]
MSLQLENVTLKVRGETYIDEANLQLDGGSFNVLLGHTLAGKTTLMRLMAGLDTPTRGRVWLGGRDMTDVPVRQRNVSMVYQQFINYPTLNVFDNIASPLKQAKVARAEIQRRVEETAHMLGIDHLLGRYPQALSGGQQQRTAMARALVKDADLVLFDEPLVNLDYKLRESLRVEMRKLFASRDTLAVYATTEPAEALALGGTTVLLKEGRIVQSGPSEAVYRQPCNLEAASLFGEPPINLLAAEIAGGECRIGRQRLPLPAAWQRLEEGHYRLGVRPHHVSLAPLATGEALCLPVQVRVAEIGGSETFLHMTHDEIDLVAHLGGIHELAVDQALEIHLPCAEMFVFEPGGELLLSPASPATAARA